MTSLADPASATLRRGKLGVSAILVTTAVSTAGTRMSALAIPWLVLVTTSDPVLVGLVSAAEMLPYVLSAVFTSPLQDRLGDRRSSIIADLISAAVVVAVAAGHQIHIGLLMGLVAAGGALRSVSDRSKTTMLRPLIDQAGVGYARITSAYEGVKRTAGLVGVSLGGVAIAVAGPEGALLFNAATFVLCALIVMAVVPRDGTLVELAGPAADTAEEPYWRSLHTGFRFYRSDRLLSNMTSMLFVTNLFNQASAVIFIPLWVLTVMGSPLALGPVAGAFAAGAIAGNIFFTLVAPYVARYPALVVGYFIGGAPRFLVLALSDNLAVVVVVTFIGGFAMCSVNPTIGTVIYQRVPAGLLARANGMMAASAYAGLPIGGLVGGLLVTGLGFTDGVLVAAGCYFLATLSPVLRPWIWRDVDAVAKPKPNLVAGAPVPAALALVRSASALRVVLRYVDGRWLVQAKQGLRPLSPAMPVRPELAVRGLVSLRNQPVRAVLQELLDHQAGQLQRRRRILQERLAGLDTRLAELTDGLAGRTAMADTRLVRFGPPQLVAGEVMLP